MITYEKAVLRALAANGGEAARIATRIEAERRGQGGGGVTYRLYTEIDGEEVLLATSMLSLALLEWWRDAGFPLDGGMPPADVFDPDTISGVPGSRLMPLRRGSGGCWGCRAGRCRRCGVDAGGEGEGDLTGCL